MKNIEIILKYGTIEFYKDNIPYYRLSKNKNTDYYSILDYKKGLITFFVAGWNKKKLIKEYINILSD